MKTIVGTDRPVSALRQHTYICDLINVEVPLLCLYRDARSNWFYLWADTDGPGTDRWLVFPVSRPTLVQYLGKQLTLRDALLGASRIFSLDTARFASEKDGKLAYTMHRRLREIDSETADLDEYVPTEDSMFDESLTDDISLAQQIVPAKYAIPIAESWFIADLEKFSRGYTKLYSFFYCTKPRFVKNIESRLAKYLRAPWKGGFSRINLFEALHDAIPAVHDMRIAKFDYASPGTITIEALGSVGESIQRVILAYLNDQYKVDYQVRLINATLNAAKLRKRDLSNVTNLDTYVAKKHIVSLNDAVESIKESLALSDEFDMLMKQSPNIVVSAKAITALVKQIERVAEFQEAGLLDLTKIS